mgnify:CR=1 FL=1
MSIRKEPKERIATRVRETVGQPLLLGGAEVRVNVSIGIAADSFIVAFERLKDEVRSGKTPRAAVQPAFARAYKTSPLPETAWLLGDARAAAGRRSSPRRRSPRAR